MAHFYWGDDAGRGRGNRFSWNAQERIRLLGGERVARRDGATGTGGVFYYFSDHLKTASVITDSAGVIKAESDYYPWGGELQFVNNDSNDYKFTGKERDSESGLDFYGARYYGSAMGRFMTPDWSAKAYPVPYANLSDPQTLNLYSYVNNNPINRIDPNGHDWFNVDNKWHWQKGHVYHDADARRRRQRATLVFLLPRRRA